MRLALVLLRYVQQAGTTPGSIEASLPESDPAHIHLRKAAVHLTGRAQRPTFQLKGRGL